MDTFLSVSREDIAEKVKLCWASNFGRHVITYRRNYAQQLNPSMAVVVQEMVSDGVAGVLFTADPVRSDPSKLIINALEGSGEQIVSGEKTPQQIEVNRIARLVVKPENCCLSAQEIDKLTEVGQFLEGLFGRPQDIEFVMKKDRLAEIVVAGEKILTDAMLQQGEQIWQTLQAIPSPKNGLYD